MKLTFSNIILIIISTLTLNFCKQENQSTSSKKIPVVNSGINLENNLISDSSQKPKPGGWQVLEKGLALGFFKSPIKSITGNSVFTIIRIDPGRIQFKILMASETGEKLKTLKQWCRQYALIGGINAGMFAQDYSTHVGYMRNLRHINNKKINSKYLSAFVFNPKKPIIPLAKMVDLDKKKLSYWVRNYQSIVQNLRLIKGNRKNLWPQKTSKWSEAALGEDKAGNILFIFSRSPYSMHDFNNILLQLPINIIKAHHLEGGPEASLYFSYKKLQFERFGSYESNFNENDDNDRAWKLPNIIGFYKK